MSSPYGQYSSNYAGLGLKPIPKTDNELMFKQIMYLKQIGDQEQAAKGEAIRYHQERGDKVDKDYTLLPPEKVPDYINKNVYDIYNQTLQFVNAKRKDYDSGLLSASDYSMYRQQASGKVAELNSLSTALTDTLNKVSDNSLDDTYKKPLREWMDSVMINGKLSLGLDENMNTMVTTIDPNTGELKSRPASELLSMLKSKQVSLPQNIPTDKPMNELAEKMGITTKNDNGNWVNTERLWDEKDDNLLRGTLNQSIGDDFRRYGNTGTWVEKLVLQQKGSYWKPQSNEELQQVAFEVIKPQIRALYSEKKETEYNGKLRSQQETERNNLRIDGDRDRAFNYGVGQDKKAENVAEITALTGMTYNVKDKDGNTLKNPDGSIKQGVRNSAVWTLKQGIQLNTGDKKYLIDRVTVDKSGRFFIGTTNAQGIEEGKPIELVKESEKAIVSKKLGLTLVDMRDKSIDYINNQTPKTLEDF